MRFLANFTSQLLCSVIPNIYRKKCRQSPAVYLLSFRFYIACFSRTNQIWVKSRNLSRLIWGFESVNTHNFILNSNIGVDRKIVHKLVDNHHNLDIVNVAEIASHEQTKHMNFWSFAIVSLPYDKPNYHCSICSLLWPCQTVVLLFIHTYATLSASVPTDKNRELNKSPQRAKSLCLDTNLKFIAIDLICRVFSVHVCMGSCNRTVM